MNDLAWVKYKPQLMMLDTLGMSKEGKIAHRQLFDMTIINDGPPLDSDDVLRELTSCSKQDWARVKGELRSKGWKTSGQFFVHAGIIETLNESKSEFVLGANRTAAANKKPRLELTEPDSVTGCVTYRVTQDVTGDVNPPPRSTPLPLPLPLPNKTTTKLPTKPKKLDAGKVGIAARFEAALNSEWINDAGKWINRIKTNPAKSERVIAEVESAAKESRIKTTPARYAEQTWKEFK